jgi:large subunit ribosomal protein L46
MITGRSICRSCKDSLSRNTYATAAAAVQTNEPALQHIPPVASASESPSYAVNAGLVLSRPPQITRDLHPFESAFFLYQRRLNERLALPFSRYFYFKKKTPADLEWKRKIKQRLTPARDIGRYKGYGEEAWNDELLLGAQESEFQYQVEKLLEDAEQTGAEAQEGETADAEPTENAPATASAAGKGTKVVHEPVERPMSRITEADLKGDVKSLNRLLPRTLYLLVKDREGKWMFPQDKVVGRETLHMVGLCLHLYWRTFFD